MRHDSGTAAHEACQLHGGRAGAGNRMLIGMVLASLALVAWHVWVYGTGGNSSGVAAGPFPLLLGRELADLFFSSKGVFAELADVLPYFLAGVLIAGWLRTYKIAVRLQASLRKYGVASVFLASLVGIITPLCACGTLTTAISLLFAGVPLAPVMALMVTSPLMSPSTYLLTLNDLGPEWTAIRTLSALAMGIFAGLVTLLLGRWGGFRMDDIFMEGNVTRGDFHDEDYPDERLRCNCRRKFGNRVAVKTGNKFYVFLAKSGETLLVVGKYVLVGVVLGEVVERYMPSGWIYRLFGEKDPLGIVWVTFASVPIFLHQISASSIVYHIKDSLSGTLDGGAALAFMIGGPVTAMPTMVLFWTFFKKRVFLLYMFVCVTGTILIAYACQFLFFVPGVDLGNPLLRGVAALSGGESEVIRKSGPNVRMVMDPGGKGIIATYADDIDGRGQVVFDGCVGRFTQVSPGQDDNGRYIENIAQWLGQDGGTGSGKEILAYGLSGDGTTPLPGEGVRAVLGRKGFRVRVTDRRETPRLTQRLLAQYGQVWLFFGGRAGNGLSGDELAEMTRYNAAGGGMLIVADGPVGVSEANPLSSRFGVTFSGSVSNGRQLTVSACSRLLTQGSEWVGRLLKLVGKA